MNTLPKSPYLLEEYRARINRVLDYIEDNLSEEFSLDELAEVAAFSKYHFHRIFAALLGESLFSFITRIRVERAAVYLCNHPKKSVTEISGECGFSSSALFSRTFRSRFRMSPSTWRSRCSESNSNQSQPDSKEGKDPPWDPPYRMVQDHTQGRSSMEGQVQITQFPKMDVAYLRHVGAYMGDGALFERLWGKMMQWASPRGLISSTTEMLCLYHDNPEITDSDKLRLSVCISVPVETEVDGEFGKMTLEGGTYAVCSFELDETQYGEAWQWVYGTWLPQSGYQPSDGAPFERYPDPEPKNGKMLVDICIPVKPL